MADAATLGAALLARPRLRHNHQCEMQGIFDRSQLGAYFLAISVTSLSKLSFSVIGLRPQPDESAVIALCFVVSVWK